MRPDIPKRIHGRNLMISYAAWKAGFEQHRAKGEEAAHALDQMPEPARVILVSYFTLPGASHRKAKDLGIRKAEFYLRLGCALETLGVLAPLLHPDGTDR